MYGYYMNPTTCSHKFCHEPLYPDYARYKWSVSYGEMVPFHTDCSYAHPEYDVSKGMGSPFTTITVAAI